MLKTTLKYIALSLWLMIHPSYATPEEAATFIRITGNTAIEHITSSKLSDAARTKEITTVIDQHFDIKSMARFALGKYWRTATPAQHETYTSLFKEYIISVYSSRFDEFLDSKLEVMGVRDEGNGGYKVLSHVVTPNRPPLQVDWKVFQTPQGYRVLDIIVAQISISITQRSEFGGIIQNAGGDIETLLKALRENIAANKKSPSPH